MAPSTRNHSKLLARSGNNEDFQIQSSNHSIEKFFKPVIQRCSVARKKGKSLVRCINNGKVKIDQISDDILSEGIFNKLPLTSLCTSKCTSKCVSKLWSNLIIQNYHRSQRLPIICRITLSTNPLRLCSIDTNTGTVTPIYNPIDLGPRKLVQPICSNGFVCYDNIRERQNMVVINPATHEKLVVRSTNDDYVHFGFDPCSNKFKLFGWKNYPDCEIYTLGTSSWRKVTSTPVQGSGKRRSMFYCFNGIIYWYSDTGMINFFHLGTESFGMIQGPMSETAGKSVDYIFDLEGFLCLAVVGNSPERNLDLWMLKDSGWVLIGRVKKPLGTNIFWSYPYLTRTGELLLAHCVEPGSQSFYLYSLLTRQFENIKIRGQDSYFILDNFRENLASMKDL